MVEFWLEQASAFYRAAGKPFNPRRAGGGVFEHPPSGFSQIAQPFLAQLFIHLFRTLCENFGPRSEVTHG